MDSGFFFPGADPGTQQRQMMAQYLQSNQNKASGPYSGIGNAGQSLFHAAITKNAMDKAADKQQGFPSKIAVTPQRSGSGLMDWANNLFSFGGG